MEQEFAGKVVLVTGGSRGMGREMVHAFAERGADVVVASRTVQHCEAVAADIRDRYRVRALPMWMCWSTTPARRRCTRASTTSPRSTSTR